MARRSHGFAIMFVIKFMCATRSSTKLRLYEKFGNAGPSIRPFVRCAFLWSFDGIKVDLFEGGSHRPKSKSLH